MQQEDLKKFCSTERKEIKEPFSEGEFSFATNGHILVRIARLTDIPEREGPPKISQVDKYFTSLIVNAVHFPIPEITMPKKISCRECGGKGKDFQCPECDGDGKVYLQTDYSSYTCSCKHCTGLRIIAGVCPGCAGCGYYYKQESYKIGDSYYNKQYLLMIRELPDCSFAPGRNVAEAGHFIFNGGDGIVMPMKP